jgi:taurine dioxygenase
MFETRRTAYALGAEVVGCDLRAPFESDTRSSLRQALLAHQVLVFRDQSLAPEQLLRFTECFGTLAPARNVVRGGSESETLAGYPDIIRLSNEEKSRTKLYGLTWHSDGLTFLERPDGVTILNCIECPSAGGDTAFAGQYMAYETLSCAYQALLRKLMWHVPELPQFAHPAVRTHRETGRTHLYMPAFARFCGMSPEESASLFTFLQAFRTDERFVYRHRWRPGDVVVWENCTTLHRVLGDTDYTERRIMNRTRTRGTIMPVRVDPDSGDPVDRAIERTDVLRLAGPTTCRQRANASGALEYVVHTEKGESIFETQCRDVENVIAGLVREKRFVAEDAMRWCEDGPAWPEVRELLTLMREQGVIYRDVFAGQCRTAQPGRIVEEGIDVMRAVSGASRP